MNRKKKCNLAFLIAEKWLERFAESYNVIGDRQTQKIIL